MKDKQAIAAEALEAVDAARRGKPHPRLNRIMDNTIDQMELRATRTRQIVKGGLMGPSVHSTESWQDGLSREDVRPSRNSK